MSLKERLLLHVCCAPDAITAYFRLKERYHPIFFFYNPNIHPEKEYEKRLEATKKLAKILNVELIVGDYNPETFFNAVKGYENRGEKSIRCYFCMKERLLKTAETAKKLGYTLFTTSLSTSPKKDTEMIKEAGVGAQKRVGVEFYFEDFKKRDGYLLSVKLSKELGIYRQNYCGCIFSLNEVNEKREKSRQLRMEKLKKFILENKLNQEFSIEPEIFKVDEQLITLLGLEKLYKLIEIIHPKKIVVDDRVYEKFWKGKKAIRCGNYRVKIYPLKQTRI